MAERVKPGMYEIGEKEPSGDREPPSIIGVVKGEVANEETYSGFGAFIGLATSKWYAYEQKEYLVQYYNVGGTGVRMHVELQKEFDSKKAAVEWAEKRYNL